MIRSALLSFLPDLTLVPIAAAALERDLAYEADPLGRWAHVRCGGAELAATATAAGLALVVRGDSFRGDPSVARAHLADLGAVSRVADLLQLAAGLPLGAVRDALDPALASAEDADLVERAVALARRHDLVEGDAREAEALVDLVLAVRELRLMAEDRLAEQVAARVEAEFAAAEVRP